MIINQLIKWRQNLTVVIFRTKNLPITKTRTNTQTKSHMEAGTLPKNGQKRKEKEITAEIVATNVVASRRLNSAACSADARAKMTWNY